MNKGRIDRRALKEILAHVHLDSDLSCSIGKLMHVSGMGHKDLRHAFSYWDYHLGRDAPTDLPELKS